MQSILRSISSVLMGFVTGFVIITLMEFANARLFPVPAGVDVTDPVALRAALGTRPAYSLALVIVGWALGTFAGAWVAARRVPELKILNGLIVGVIFLAGAITNMLEIPHPIWFWIAGLAVFLPAAFLGANLAARGARPVPRAG